MGSLSGRLVAAAFAATLLAGCQSIDMGSAQLRVIDASVDGGALDIYQNNVGLTYNLGFGNLTSYIAMSPGAYKLEADKGGTRQTLVENTVHLAAGKQYTEIVERNLVSLQATVLLDQSTPAPTGEIAMRFVHQALRAGAVDIYLVGGGGRLASTSPIQTNMGFGANSGYLNVPAGTYAVDIVPTGTVLSGNAAPLLRGAQRPYDSGAVRTVVLLDQEIVGVHPAGLNAGVQVVIAADADGVQ
jgi:hypothetical protein